MRSSSIRIKKFLISPRTIISLIMIILIACVAGSLIPQAADKSPSYFETWKEKNIYTYRFVNRLQLNRVYTSFWFLSAVFLVTVSLGYSVYLQVRRNLRQTTDHGPQTTDIFETEAPDKIKSVFISRGYRLLTVRNSQTSVNRERKLIFAKNSIGRWGSVIFHSGLLLVIVSALIAFSFQKRGFVQLIEGETFDGRDDDFLVKDMGILTKDFNPDFKTHLRGFRHTYWENWQVKFVESSLTVINDGKTTRRMLSVNNPLVVNGTKIYQSLDYGYALSFILKQQSGEEILTRFTLDRPADVNKPAIGKSDFPTTGYLFEMKFYPDIRKPSFYPAMPILYLTVYKNRSADPSQIIFNGLLLPGNAVKLGEDVLYFADIRNWSGLIFAENPGIFITYAGFIAGIAGAVMIFLMPYKEIHASVDASGNIAIDGMTKRYNALFREEMKEIEDELRKDMKEAAAHQQSFVREHG